MDGTPARFAICTSHFGNGPGILVSGLLAVAITLTVPYSRLKFPVIHGKRVAPEWTWYRGPYPVADFAERYRSKLDRLGAELVRRYLRRLADENRKPGVILLGWTDLLAGAKDAWCHRRVFAEWWNEQTGEDIPEQLNIAGVGDFTGALIAEIPQ